MECVSPPELDERSLWTFVDGEADQETTRHLELCEFCRGRAKDLAQLSQRLRSRVYRISCPPSLELGEYHLHMLPAAQALIVAQHVRECQHCTRELAQLEGFLGDLASTPQEGLLGSAKTLIARLVGRESSFAPALRGDSKGPITFEADGIVITLDIQPGLNGQVSILGQVAADDQDQWTGAVVELRQTDALQLIASLDDLGAFTIKDVPQSLTQITIISPQGIAIQSPDFNIVF